MRHQKRRTRLLAVPTVLVLFTLAVGGTLQAQATDHVSPGGDDRNDGKSAATSWRTVARVNSQSLQPGDQTHFERRGEWRECLAPRSGGTVDRPIVFGTPGKDPKPKFWDSDPLDQGSFQPGWKVLSRSRWR